MMLAIGLFSAIVMPSATPVLQLGTQGEVVASRICVGTSSVQTPHGIGFGFTGSHAGILVPDQPALALTKSLTLSTWLFLDAYTTADNSSPGAQIIFRGDDRSGLDPYHLTVNADGTVGFGIEDGKGAGAWINAPIELHQWVHVLGSLDDKTGAMHLYLNGQLVANTLTKLRPGGALDPGSFPGIGIGNVQAPNRGLHNQPLHGIIADLRIYDAVVSPQDAGFRARRVEFEDGSAKIRR